MRGRANAHGNPIGRHILGISHYLPGCDLSTLSEVMDILPPTRLALSESNLGTRTTTVEDPQLATSDPYGLSMGLEAVAQGTDLLRTTVSRSRNDEKDAATWFGAGTLFGEVWCAQELAGARETLVVCDDDGLDDDNHHHTMDERMNRIRSAYEQSSSWRAGAAARRAEEQEAATRASNKWYAPAVEEAAAMLGLEMESVTLQRVSDRWRVLAFKYHPDTKSILHSSVVKEDEASSSSFGELRMHYLTLMEALQKKRPSQ